MAIKSVGMPGSLNSDLLQDHACRLSMRGSDIYHLLHVWTDQGLFLPLATGRDQLHPLSSHNRRCHRYDLCDHYGLYKLSDSAGNRNHHNIQSVYCDRINDDACDYFNPIHCFRSFGNDPKYSGKPSHQSCQYNGVQTILINSGKVSISKRPATKSDAATVSKSKHLSYDHSAFWTVSGRTIPDACTRIKDTWRQIKVIILLRSSTTPSTQTRVNIAINQKDFELH